MDQDIARTMYKSMLEGRNDLINTVYIGCNMTIIILQGHYFIWVYDQINGHWTDINRGNEEVPNVSDRYG